MASPQLENGHFRIANEIAENLASLSLSDYESACLWVVLRRTYGWSKKKSQISFGEFERMTGISKANCNRALKSLISRHIVCKEDTLPNTYWVQKNHEEWLYKRKVSSLETKGVYSPKTIGDSLDRLQGDSLDRLPQSKDILKTTKDSIYVVPPSSPKRLQDSHKDAIDQIITAYNEITESNIKITAKCNRTFVRARLEDGYKVEDFRKVFRVKYKEWKDDPTMKKYISLETFTRPTKFDKYLNQKEVSEFDAYYYKT